MITTNGKTVIKRYLGQETGVIGSALSIGVGPSVAALGNKTLQFEVERVPVLATSYDVVNDKILYKAELPLNLACSIYEIGLWTSFENGLAGGAGSKLITDFNENDWVGGVNSPTNSRIDRGVLVSGAAGTTQSTTQSGILLDISENLKDSISIALNSTGKLSLIKVHFISAGGSYIINIDPAVDYGGVSPTNYYGVHTAAMSSYTTTGTPDATDINSIKVDVTAAAGSALSTLLDGVRIEDTFQESLNPEYHMVSRSSSTTPLFVKLAGQVSEIEYRLGVVI